MPNYQISRPKAQRGPKNEWLLDIKSQNQTQSYQASQNSDHTFRSITIAKLYL